VTVRQTDPDAIDLHDPSGPQPGGELRRVVVPGDGVGGRHLGQSLEHERIGDVPGVEDPIRVCQRADQRRR
jgi:hypothetical protein